ncbi:NepR family anti-sigma factor [Sphingomonas aliaeris]|nr:NepR family anti-sigma factor [Sphingomonas aliaeris]
MRFNTVDLFASQVEQSGRYLVSCTRRTLYVRSIGMSCRRDVLTRPVYRYVISYPAAAGIFRGTALRSGDESSKSLKKPGSAGKTNVQSKDRDMGAALRTVYQKTVEEDVPSDLLDLLGKLD